MACIVGQFREEGEGTTKKIAKRLAAYKMLKLLNPEKSSDANLESNSRDGARKLNVSNFFDKIFNLKVNNNFNASF